MLQWKYVIIWIIYQVQIQRCLLRLCGVIVDDLRLSKNGSMTVFFQWLIQIISKVLPKYKKFQSIFWNKRVKMLTVPIKNRKTLWILLQWVNGKKVMEHEIGHLPFVEEVTSFLKFGKENKLTVAVSNILGQETIPQGRLRQVPTWECLQYNLTVAIIERWSHM